MPTRNDSPIDEAVRVRDRLLDIAKELRRRRDGHDELNEMDAKTCEQAAAFMQKFGTEVFRLRESIGHFQYGMMGRIELIRVPNTWNGEQADAG